MLCYVPHNIQSAYGMHVCLSEVMYEDIGSMNFNPNLLTRYCSIQLNALTGLD